MQEWFKARNVWGLALESLSDEDAGILMKALWHYTRTGEEADIRPELKGYLVMMLLSLKQDEENNANLSRKRAIAGAMGGNQRVANQANSSNATDAEANEANEHNKNKNKNKNIEKEKEKEKERELISERFDRFWSVYPKKTDKQAARKEFEKLSPDEDLLNIILNAISRQKASKQWKDAQYIPYPSTWLHGKRWEDELSGGGSYTQRDYSNETSEAMERMLAYDHSLDEIF